MHRARALSNKMKNDREDGHCYSRLCVDLLILDIRLPLHFFPKTDFIYNRIYTLSKIGHKLSVGSKKNSRFLSTGHRILQTCDCKVRETQAMVAKFELVL